jgi:hypothetical protein
MSSSRPSNRAEPAAGSVSEADSQDYSEDAYTDELIERILENYEFKCQPEIRFKLKHKCVWGNALKKRRSPREPSRACATGILECSSCMLACIMSRALPHSLVHASSQKQQAKLHHSHYGSNALLAQSCPCSACTSDEVYLSAVGKHTCISHHVAMAHNPLRFFSIYSSMRRASICAAVHDPTYCDLLCAGCRSWRCVHATADLGMQRQGGASQ